MHPMALWELKLNILMNHVKPWTLARLFELKKTNPKNHDGPSNKEGFDSV